MDCQILYCNVIELMARFFLSIKVLTEWKIWSKSEICLIGGRNYSTKSTGFFFFYFREYVNDAVISLNTL